MHRRHPIHRRRAPTLLVLLTLLTAQTAQAQYWMREAITERVALWLRVQDGNWDPAPCAFDAKDLETAVFKMSFTPITLPGCAASPSYRVVVDPRTLDLEGEESTTLVCSHTDYHQVTLVVALHTPQSVVLQGGTSSTVTGAPELVVISGPIFTDSEYRWGGPDITPLERAQARLAYLDPEDVRPARSTRAYTAFRALPRAAHAGGSASTRTTATVLRSLPWA